MKAAILALALTSIAAFAEPASAKPARCLLVVEGVTYIDGPCDFRFPLDLSSLDTRIRTTNAGYQTEVSRHWTAAEIVREGVMVGYWSGEPFALHAHNSLGTLFRSRRDPACWVGEIATVCAW